MPEVDASALYDKGSFEMDRRLDEEPRAITIDMLQRQHDRYQVGLRSIEADESVPPWIRLIARTALQSVE